MVDQPNAPDENTSGANLECLPTEIKVLVLLNLPDPSSLRALVRASPSYHELYVRQRQLLLSISLFNNLHLDGLYTALTVEEASRISHAPDEHGSLDDLYVDRKALRARYFQQPSSKLFSWQWLQGVSFETLVSIIHRHWMVTAIASHYFEEKTSMNPVTGESESAHINSQPSRSEIHRIHRALYHFELYCLLFVSHNAREDPDTYPFASKLVALHYTEYQSAIRAFLPLLESWEIEEIACIREHIFSHYSQILQDCAQKLLDREMEGIERIFSLPGCRRFYLEKKKWMLKAANKRKEYLMSCGLKIFLALSQAHTAEDQAEIIYSHPWQRKHFLTDAILAYRNAERADLSKWDEVYRIVIPFTSDNEGPNAALPWSRFSDLDFFYKGRDFLRNWGYVMWDLGRLKKWKVLEQDPEVWLGSQEVAPHLNADRWGCVTTPLGPEALN